MSVFYNYVFHIMNLLGLSFMADLFIFMILQSRYMYKLMISSIV